MRISMKIKLLDWIPCYTISSTLKSFICVQSYLYTCHGVDVYRMYIGIDGTDDGSPSLVYCVKLYRCTEHGMYFTGTKNSSLMQISPERLSPQLANYSSQQFLLGTETSCQTPQYHS